MTTEIQLINDGDGLAIIGDPVAIELFLSAEGIESKDMGLERLDTALRIGSGVADAASILSATAGRWVMLSEKSAHLFASAEKMKGSSPELVRAIITNKGKTANILEIVKSPATFLANPAFLTGAAGIMSQLAMQASMDEITDYLAVIDEKVDDVLRAQKDAALAEMIGVGFVLQEAITLREHTGRVSEITWSKVQATPQTLAWAQAYALRQLDGIAEKLENKDNVAELAKTARAAEPKVREWLAVLARCFQLQDAVAILELDRVLDAAPDELDKHRIGLRAGRQDRLDIIAQTTVRLLTRIDAAATSSNAKVLLHPIDSRAVVNASNHVAVGVLEFQARLGIEQSRESLEATRWLDAAVGVKDDVLRNGADGVDAVARFGNETFINARSFADKLSLKIAEGALSRRAGDDPDDKELSRKSE